MEEFIPVNIKPEKKAKAVTVIPVTILARQGESVLVEWQDKNGLRRGTIPVRELAEKVSMEVLDMGIPYGVDWAGFTFAHPTGKQLELALHEQGIWTLEDLCSKPNIVIGILQRLYWGDLSALIKFANSQKEKK